LVPFFESSFDATFVSVELEVSLVVLELLVVLPLAELDEEA
jgi:hypothetical protein